MSSQPVRLPDPFNRDNFVIGPAWPRSATGRLAYGLARKVVKGAVRGAELLRDCGFELGVGDDSRDGEQAVSAWMDARGWPARSLRIGLMSPGEWAAEIVAAHGVFVPQWMPLHASALPDRAAINRNLDAVVFLDADAGLRVVTPENPGRRAPIQDWIGDAGAISYPTLFPLRLDSSRLTLGAIPQNATQASIVRLLVEAAAIGSRHPMRLTLDDRLEGRTALGSQMVDDEESAEIRRGPEPIDAVMRELAVTLALARPEQIEGTAAMIAGRMLGAWAATREGRIDDAVRRTAAEVALRLLPEDPATVLRVAAVRLGDTDDAQGIELLRLAVRLLTGTPWTGGSDAMSFIESELKGSSNAPLAVGRVCAGLALLAASHPHEHFETLHDDVVVEARYSDLLMERDQDKALMMQVMGVLREATSGNGGASVEPTPAPSPEHEPLIHAEPADVHAATVDLAVEEVAPKRVVRIRRPKPAAATNATPDRPPAQKRARKSKKAEPTATDPAPTDQPVAGEIGGTKKTSTRRKAA